MREECHANSLLKLENFLNNHLEKKRILVIIHVGTNDAVIYEGTGIMDKLFQLK